MKRFKIISLFVSCLAISFNSYALLPKIDLQPIWVRVTEVELTDSATRVGLRLQNIPGNWVKFSSTGRLIADGDTTLQYKLIGTENIELDKEIWITESGTHEGVLLFEKVPESVKVVNLVEIDPEDTPNNVIGIHLDEPETRIRPKLLTVADIIGDNQKAKDPWTGLDPTKYKDLSFYNPNGKTHVKGKINDYTPRCGFSTVSMITYDDFTGRQYPNTAIIASDGSFEMDVNVRYPQFDSLDFGEPHQNSFIIPDGKKHNYMFLIPGDTISVSTCLASHLDKNKGIVPDYFGFDGNPTESSVISLLADSLINKRYGFDTLYFRKYENDMFSDSYSIESDTYKITHKLCILLDSIVEDLPILLGNLPISSYAKDVLSAYAAGQIELLMEEFEMQLKFFGSNIKRREDGSLTYESGPKYDIMTIMIPKIRHKELLFDNPLVLCLSGILLKRWEDNALFKRSKHATMGMIVSSDGESFHGVSDLSLPFDNSSQFLDSIGVGNCFAAQFVKTKSFIDNLYTMIGPADALLEFYSRMLPYIIKNNSSEKMNSILMKEYNDYIKNAAITANLLNTEDNHLRIIEGYDAEDILSKIISPYKGNVLYLDFWGMSCAPCRAGMIQQKPLIESLTDKPFRVLYIANTEDGVESCKTWLRSEGIQGEHIFISNEAWKRLSQLFNINQIPFGILIDKDSNVIETGLTTLSIDNPHLQKALKE
ncbi:MAG: hypothetical protein K2K25_02445 [Muribaculaceae bacterium]|nr:hypothetical protein [Muribaculaceae bacterium]